MATMQGVWRAVMALVLLLVPCTAAGVGRGTVVPAIRHWNATCMLVFGDSSVDPGNNNRLSTSFKANFPPYGKDFFGGRPTGRFCDGRLATDFIAESLGISMSIPAFLDPNLTPAQLKHGVSFASASSGYDELTAIYAGVLTIPKQIEYLKHYKARLQKLFGAAEAQKTVRDSIVVVSAGTNDFIQNYYFYANRSTEFTEPQYEDYLVSLMSEYIKEINREGAKRFVLVGVPPMGCFPIVKTMQSSKECFEKLNEVASSLNSKMKKQLSALRKQLGLKVAFLDIYTLFEQATKSPTKYGFGETAKGCCGSGTIEIGQLCKGQATCNKPERYMYWDAVHPTQKMYKIIAGVAFNDIVDAVLS